MRARLLADADLRFAIVRSFRQVEPAADFAGAQRIIPESMQDAEVLTLAAELNRVLVSHDFKTMPAHFYRFLDRRESPGVILIPQHWRVSQAVEELRIAWVCQDAEEFRNRIVYLPV